MKRDFFQKNILTIGIVVVFIAILFTIINPFNSKQSSNKESLNKLKKEIGQLKQENENINKKLETEKSFYTDKIKQSDQAFIASATATGESNALLIEYLQKGIKNELVDSLGIFSPEYTKSGDKIAGLTVSDVISEPRNGSTSYHINFTGEFVVVGRLIHSEADGSYALIVEENLEKLPHTLQEFEGVHFTISNEKELFKAFDKEKIDELPATTQLMVECVFKNYSYSYLSESDMGNSAEFVRQVSQNK